jgi:hypothetical protein
LAGIYPKITPVDCRVAAFRAVVRLLTASPACLPVRTWKVWTDADDSAIEPTLDQLPCVRVTPYAGPVERKAGRGVGPPATYRSTLKLELEVFVPGCRVDDLGNLWGRLESAIFGPNTAAALGAVGVRDLWLVKPAIPDGAAGYGDEDLVGIGEVHFDVWFDL